jgi:hypothetical protein
VIHDFDRVIDRRATESNKWHKYPADVLPLWVADMDFRSPEPVLRALHDRIEHGVFGYGMEQAEFYEVFLDRLARLRLRPTRHVDSARRRNGVDHTGGAPRSSLSCGAAAMD